jgi:hypothetical protein
MKFSCNSPRISYRTPVFWLPASKKLYAAFTVSMFTAGIAPTFKRPGFSCSQNCDIEDKQFSGGAYATGTLLLLPH